MPSIGHLEDSRVLPPQQAQKMGEEGGNASNLLSFVLVQMVKECVLGMDLEWAGCAT